MTTHNPWLSLLAVAICMAPFLVAIAVVLIVGRK